MDIMIYEKAIGGYAYSSGSSGGVLVRLVDQIVERDCSGFGVYQAIKQGGNGGKPRSLEKNIK